MVISLVVVSYFALCLENGEAVLIEDGRSAATTERFDSPGEEVTRRCVRWGYDPIQLLFDSRVSRELHVAAGQQRLLDLVKDELLAALRELFTSSQPPKQRDSHSAGTIADLATRQRLLMDGANARAVSVLDDSQRYRLQQVVIQLREVEAFYDNDIRNLLDLSDLQEAKLVAIRRSVWHQSNELRERHGRESSGDEDFRREVDRLLREAKTQFVRNLSDQQVAALRELEGPPIDFQRRHLHLELRATSSPSRSELTERVAPESRSQGDSANARSSNASITRSAMDRLRARRSLVCTGTRRDIQSTRRDAREN